MTAWGIIPTATSYIPTASSTKRAVGQLQQLGSMVQISDKVHLKKTQIAGILDAKKKCTTEHHIQQFALLQSFLEIDLENEKNDLTGSAVKPPLGAYVLDTQWTKFENAEMATFERLLFTTGYCKAYWQCPNLWRHCELDMCHIKNEFGGFISLLTHSTSNGRNKILAFGVHPAENGVEWKIFFDFCIKHFPGIEHVTSDREKGLTAVEENAICMGKLRCVSHCILHIVRNENDARKKHNAGGFNASAAGGSVQNLGTKLAKACSNEMYDFYLEKIKMGNEFTANFLHSRRSMFATSSLINRIDDCSTSVQLAGSIPAQARKGKVSSNTAEQSNSDSGINKHRTEPILDLVKGIATKMATQHHKVSA